MSVVVAQLNSHLCWIINNKRQFNWLKKIENNSHVQNKCETSPFHVIWWTRDFWRSRKQIEQMLWLLSLICRPFKKWRSCSTHSTSSLTRSFTFSSILLFPFLDKLSPCRKKLLNWLKSPHRDKDMPWCQTDGSFNPMQCYGSYCYCVNEKGNQMPGTKISVSVGRPVCTYTSKRY